MCLFVSSCSTGVTVALQLLRSVVEIVGPHAVEEALDVVGCSTLYFSALFCSLHYSHSNIHTLNVSLKMSRTLYSFPLHLLTGTFLSLQRSPVFVELFQFVLWSTPFGSPLDLSVANFRAVHHQVQPKGKRVKQAPPLSVVCIPLHQVYG